MKFYEKLLVLIVVFVIVFITTAGIVGNYVRIKKEAEDRKNNSFVLDNINLF